MYKKRKKHEKISSMSNEQKYLHYRSRLNTDNENYKRRVRLIEIFNIIYTCSIRCNYITKDNCNHFDSDPIDSIFFSDIKYHPDFKWYTNEANDYDCLKTNPRGDETYLIDENKNYIRIYFNYFELIPLSEEELNELKEIDLIIKKENEEKKQKNVNKILKKIEYNETTLIPFGKYKDKLTFKQAKIQDPSYIKWIFQNSTDEKLKNYLLTI